MALWASSKEDIVYHRCFWGHQIVRPGVHLSDLRVSELRGTKSTNDWIEKTRGFVVVDKYNPLMGDNL